MLKNAALLTLIILLFTFLNTHSQTITIGSFADTVGTPSVNPFTQSEEAFRFQILYTRTELNAAGISGPKLLEQIGFFLTELPDTAFLDYQVRVQHTDDGNLSGHTLYGFQDKLHLPRLEPVANDWTILNFDQSFYWNGVDNILLDICYAVAGPTNNNGKMVVHNVGVVSKRYTEEPSSELDICANYTTKTSISKPTAQFQFLDIVANDAGVSQIIDPPAETGSGPNPLSVLLTNYGTDNLTSAQINWRVNGGATSSESWTGDLNPLQQTDTIVLPAILLDGGVNVIEVWTSNPNGVEDTNTANDRQQKQVKVITDAGVVATGVPFDVCEGNQEVYVDIQNFGIDTLYSVDIAWTFQGVAQPTQTWTGVLYPDSIAPNIYLGDVTFGLGTDFEFEFQTGAPNTFLDENPENDAFYFLTDTVRMNGTYTVGGENPDFLTIQDAIDSLGTTGVCDPTTIAIRPGVYEELLNIPLIPGTSAENTVLFTAEDQDSASVLIEALPNPSHNLLELRRASFVTFQHLTIKSLRALSSVAYITDFAHDVTFDQVRFLREGVTNRDLLYVHGDILNFTLSNSYIGGKMRNSSAVGNVYYHNEGLKILYNEFEGGGIYVEYGEDVEIVGNRLTHVGGNQSNIDIEETPILNIQKNWIKNNGLAMVIDHSGSTAQSIIANNYSQGSWDLSDIQNLTVTYNTIIHRDGTLRPIPLTVDDCDRIWIKNNIIIEEQPNQRVLNYYNNSNDSLDYNIYFNSADAFSYVLNNYPTFAQFQNTFNENDIHSLFYKVEFLSPDAPHTVDFTVYQAGITTTMVSDDIDGDIRENPPCIGADEIVVLPQNVQIADLYIEAEDCEGTQNVYADFTNTGMADLTTFDAHFNINGTDQPAVNWTGNISTGQNTGHILLGTVPLQTYQFTEVQAWATMPNGAIVEDTDTLQVQTYPNGMSGTFLVGPTAGDFATLQQAIDSLEYRGICSTVYLELESGTYDGAVTINAIPGAEGDALVVIRSATLDSTAVTLTSNASTVLELGDTRNIVLEHLGLASTNSSQFSSIINLVDTCANITFRNCHLNHDIGRGIYAHSSTYGDQITIQHNYFQTKQPGLFLTGNSIAHSNRCLIDANYFTGQLNHSIFVTEFDSLAIVNNDIFLDGQFSTSTFGSIYVAEVDSSLLIYNNYIKGIHSFGIFLEDLNGSGDATLEVVNNVISLVSADAYSGIRLVEADFVKVIHNSIYVQNTSDLQGAAFSHHITSDSNLIQNNIFANFGTGPAADIFPGNYIDYNAYYSNGENLLTSSGLQFPTLEDWQSYSNRDQHSLTTNPGYVSATDLHIVGNTFLNDAGIGGLTMLPDIDGDLRHPENPDIGADEFNPVIVDLDAGLTYIFSEHITCGGPNTISVLLHNYGTLPITEVSIIVEQDGTPVDTVLWTGNLSADATDTVEILTQDFILTTTVSARIESVNGGVDEIDFNDQSETEVIDFALNGVYTIGGDTPDFSAIEDAISTLNSKGLCGPVTFNIRPGIYLEPVNLTNFEGLSASNTLTFQSELLDSSSVTIFNLFEPTVTLNGGGHFFIRHLTVVNEEPDGLAFNLLAQNDLVIENCHIIGDMVSPYFTFSFERYTIQNCRIEGKLTLSGDNSGQHSTLLQFIGNTVISAGPHRFDNNDLMVVEGNTFTDPNLAYSPGNLLDLYFCNQGKVSRNQFVGNKDFLLRLEKCFGTTEMPFSIDNNGLSTANHYTDGLLLLQEVDEIQIIYNTFHSNSTGHALRFDSDPTGRMLNNIIYDASGNGAIHLVTAASGNMNANNNIYYATNPACITLASGSEYTLSDFQATFSTEGNSHFFDPQLSSSTGLFSENPAILGLAQPITDIDYDLLQEDRDDTAPTPGCYERLAPSAVFANAGPDRTISCNETSIELMGEGSTGPDYVYEWTTANGEILSGEHTLTPTVNAPGTYVLTVFLFDTQSNNLARDTMFVTSDLLDITINANEATCSNADGSATVVIVGDVTNPQLAWSTGADTETIEGLSQGWYSVTVTTESCSIHQNVFVDEELSCKVIISGSVYDDNSMADCVIDTATTGIENALIHLLPADLYTFTDEMGTYEFAVPPGNYTIEYLPSGPLYDFVCPEGALEVSLPDAGTLSDNNDFFLERNSIEDLSVTGFSDEAIPGFEQAYHLQVCNNGDLPVDQAELRFTHDLALEGSILSTLAQSYDPLTGMASWNMNNLAAGECFDLTFNLLVPPMTDLGSFLLSHATVSSGEIDSQPNDNSTYWNRIVVGSYDPNDKQINNSDDPFGSTITSIDTTLHYQIRFQNTGTYPAFTVVVRDTLDPSLDVSTIRPGLASHDYELSFEGNNVLVFTFENIMLPDSASNEPASHGYVTFTIDVKPGLGLGTLIKNSAAIYFDFNEPIITNTVSTEVTETNSSQNVQNNDFNFKIQPNPNTGIFSVAFELSSAQRIELHLLNTMGEALQVISPQRYFSAGEHALQLSASDLPAGTYWLLFKSEKQTGVRKFVKLN